MAPLRNFNGLASWRNAENSQQSVNLTMPARVTVKASAARIGDSIDQELDTAERL